MILPAIYDEVRLLIWVITGIGGLAFGVLALLLEPNLKHWLRRRIPGERRQGGLPTKRPILSWLYYFLSSSIFILGTAFASSAPRAVKLDPMAGDFRIAVAGFDVNGIIKDKKLGLELAQGVKLRFDKDLKEINPDLVLTIWGPDQVGYIKGKDRDSRAKGAERLAKEINADMVVYGAVDVTQPVWQVVPEFYLKDNSFQQGDEIVGQYEFGSPIIMLGNDNVAGRVELGEKMATRGKVLSRVAIGLAYYAVHQYDKSMSYFHSTEAVQNWTDNQGKKVVYLLIGNAAGKAAQIAKAEEFYQKSLAIDPSYARAYVGLGSVAYSQSLTPFSASMNPEDIDATQLDLAVQHYLQALQAANKPPLSDIDIKVHFGLGQCYLLRVYSGKDETFDLAIGEFNQVILGYQDGNNNRVQELASEAHARLGLIYKLSGFPEKALEEYQLALLLTDTNSERWKIYHDEIPNLQSMIPTPTR